MPCSSIQKCGLSTRITLEQKKSYENTQFSALLILVESHHADAGVWHALTASWHAVALLVVGDVGISWCHDDRGFHFLLCPLLYFLDFLQ